MPIKTQRWAPDTHPGFALDTEWSYPEEPEGGWPDPENPPSPTFIRCFRATKDNVELPEPDALHTLILSENQTKNRALAALGAVLPGLEPVWVFGEADGIVSITLPEATAQQMLIAQAALAEFGGAVVLG
jgi:hypothetical protein